MRSIPSRAGTNSTDDRKSIISGNSSNASTLVPESITSSKTTTSQLRKFAQQVSRPGQAREAREAVRNVISTQNPTRLPPIAEPLDYEKFVTERSIQLENDPQRDILIFPRDDIGESLLQPECSTISSPVSPEDVTSSQWLLTQEAIRLYTSPHRTIVFNYGKFAGDYNKVIQGSCAENVTLSSLVFESDMAVEEEKAAMEGFYLSDVVKEGYIMVVKSDPSLLDNLKAAKKRYCILRREEGGQIAFEVRKSQGDPPKRPPMKVNSAQLKSTKKGKTVLQIEPCPDENEKTDQKPLTITSDDPDELSSWLLNVNRAIAFANKGDSVSSCSELTERPGRKVSDAAPDTISIGSEDSSASRDTAVWRGRNSAARALQPPIVDRRNMFSLFYHLSPLPEAKGDASSVLSRSRWGSPGPSPLTSPGTPNTRRRSTLTSNGNPCSGGQAVRFAIEYKKLELKLPIGNNTLQQIEPFFVSFFVFDAQAGRRLSEEFVVDSASSDDVTFRTTDPSGEVNGVSKMLLGHRAANKMLCTVAAPHKDLWIICRVDRLLSADTVGDLYMKSNVDAKAVLKLQKQIQTSSVRLTGYRQRFAWAARPVFPELKSGDGSTGSSKDKGTLQLYRCEGNKLTEVDIHKYLSDFSKLEKAGKMTLPNGTVSLKVDISAKPGDFGFRVNPSYLPLRPWTSARDSPVPPVFELQPFNDIVGEPHSELVNLLYIYPLGLKYDGQKVFSKARNISCTVRFVRGDDQVSNQAFIDRLAPTGPFVSHASCAVQHHQQSPSFGDEIKMRLPLSLTATDHLLFSFAHVSVAGQTSVKSPEGTDTPVGYAWLPLVWKRDRLVLESDEQEFALPVAVDLPHGYLRSKPLGLGKGDEVSEVRWVDQKALFRFRLRMVSSAFTTDAKLQSFFQACQRLESKGVVGDATELVKRSSKSASPGSSGDPARSCSPLVRSASLDEEHPTVVELVRKTDALCDVSIEKIVPFLPVVLSRLFSLLPRAPTEQLALSTLSAIVSICDRCSTTGQKGLLRAFIRLHFHTSDSGDETTHSAICKYLTVLIRSVQSSNDELAAIYRQFWFLLDITSKSLAQVIVQRSLFKSSRRERFPSDLLESMGSLIETVVPQFIAKHRDLPEESRSANTAVAYFIRCCMSFIDRGVVFKWLHFCVLKMDENDSRVLREYKADMLTTICQHEHWLPLCLPVLLDTKNNIQRINYQSIQVESTTTASANGSGFLTRFFNQIFQTPSMTEISESDRYSCCVDEWYLSKPYASRHFPIGLLLQELTACLREPRDYRRRPIALLRNILAKHSYDKRYSDMNIQRRISLLYAPLIRFAMDIVHELQAATAESTDAHTGLPKKSRYLERRSTFVTDTLRPSSVILTPSAPVAPPLAEKLDSDEVQDILICVLWVLHRLPKRIMGAIWAESEGSRAPTLLRLMEITLDVFRYKGKEHALAATSREIRATKRTVHLLPPSSSSRLPSVDMNSQNVSEQFKLEDEPAAPLPFGVLQLLNLSQETALVVLDTLQTFAQHLSARRGKVMPGEEDLFCRLLSMHLSLLEDNWPEAVRLHAIAALALFVNLFRARLFDGGPLDALSLLIERILLQMASRLATVQNAAAALLQLILRNGYETAQALLAKQALDLSVAPQSKSNDTRPLTAAERLGRPGAQTGVALARLLGVKCGLSSSGRFEKGLTALESLVGSDSKKGTVFDRAVLDLLRQLRGVMMATVALKDAANDPIRLADLHIQLADSYRGSAALRSAWFDTLAEAHAADRWYSESAVCHAHSVAIMAKELKDKGELDFDWAVFSWISKEVVDTEQAREKERNVQPAGFTMENLAAKIEKTQAALTLAERFEAIGPLYRILIPVLEQRNNFASLVSVYAELQQKYSRAQEVKTSGRRHLATYFRVRFYGKNHFDEDHDTEWIYREAGLTSLAEVSLRLKETCRAALGHDRVQIAPEAELDLSKLDSMTAYVQVTHVDPVLGEGLREKDFWSHTNISKFAFESPIIEGEKKEKEPHITQQALKKVTLEVDGQFPSSRRRLPVCSRSEQVFSPLRFACQKLSIKADQIKATLGGPEEGRQLDVKGLQLLLQGAVMPTVNAGPLAYAEAFTQPEQRERYGEQGIKQLQDAFIGLMSACESALTANQKAVGADQQTYHEVLVSSFDAMHERLQNFFGASLRAQREEEANPQVSKTAIHIFDSIGGVNA